MILHLRPSQKAMCEKWQPYSSRILPPSSGRRCPEGAEVGFRCGIEKQCEMCHPVSSSRAQPRDLSGRPINGRRDTAGKRNTKTSIFTLTWITAEQGRFLDFARNDVTRKPPAANVPLSDYTLRRYEKNALRSPSGIPPRCELVEEGHTEGSGLMAAI